MVESKAGSSLLGARSWGSQAEQWLRTQVPAHLGRGVSPSWSSTLAAARVGRPRPGLPLHRWEMEIQREPGSRSNSRCPAKDPVPTPGADTLRTPSGLQAKQEGDPPLPPFC